MLPHGHPEYPALGFLDSSVHQCYFAPIKKVTSARHSCTPVFLLTRLRQRYLVKIMKLIHGPAWSFQWLFLEANSTVWNSRPFMTPCPQQAFTYSDAYQILIRKETSLNLLVNILGRQNFRLNGVLSQFLLSKQKQAQFTAIKALIKQSMGKCQWELTAVTSHLQY